VIVETIGLVTVTNTVILYLLMLIVACVGQIECYNLSSRSRLSYEAAFVNPVGIFVFNGRLYVSDAARETISSVALDLSSEHILQRNVQQPGIVKVYFTRLNGICTVEFVASNLFQCHTLLAKI